jgi:hypothetical protein
MATGFHTTKTKTMTNLKLKDFDKIKALYPNGFMAFDEWLTAYRERVSWPKLFNSDSDWQDMHGKNAKAPKYHELPGAMQAGIWIQFMKERGGCSWEVDLFDWELLEDITGAMPMLEDENQEKYGLTPTVYYGKGSELAKAIDEEVLENAKKLGEPYISDDETLQGYPSERIAFESQLGMDTRKFRNNDGEEPR